MTTSTAHPGRRPDSRSPESRAAAAMVVLGAAITALALVAGTSTRNVEAPAEPAPPIETTSPITSSQDFRFPLGGGGSVIFDN